MSRFYVTTAIPYANGAPHIGHAYERIATDAIQRFMRLDGRDTLFVTGMDEYGLKVQQTAAREGVTPQAFVDRVAAEFEAMGEHAERPRRRHRAHDAVPQRPRRAGDLGADGGERRRLSLEIFRLVFGAGRSLFRRERAESRPGRDQARADRRPRRLGGGGELVLPPVGLGRPAPRPLRGPPGFRHAGEISQRDRRLREARALGPVDQPRDPRLGNARAGRPEARHVCLGRRADQLHHRDRLPRRRPAREILAGRRACDRQGHHPLPRHLLAGVPDVGRTARAAAGRRARISVQPRREDVEVGRQRGEPGRSRRGLRPRSGALLLPARGAVRAGRQLLARGDRQPDDRRSRQRHRQPGAAFAHHDRQELRGRRARPDGRRARAGGSRDPRPRRRAPRRGAPPHAGLPHPPLCRRRVRGRRRGEPLFRQCRALEARQERPGADAARPLRDDRDAAHLRDPAAAGHARQHGEAARSARAPPDRRTFAALEAGRPRAASTRRIGSSRAGRCLPRRRSFRATSSPRRRREADRQPLPSRLSRLRRRTRRGRRAGARRRGRADDHHRDAARPGGAGRRDRRAL